MNPSPTPAPARLRLLRSLVTVTLTLAWMVIAALFYAGCVFSLLETYFKDAEKLHPVVRHGIFVVYDANVPVAEGFDE